MWTTASASSSSSSSSSSVAAASPNYRALFPEVAALRAASLAQQATLGAFLVNQHEHVLAVVRTWTSKGTRDVDQSLINAVINVAELTRSSLSVLTACTSDEISRCASEVALVRASSGANKLTTAFLRVRGLSWLRAALRAPATALSEVPDEESLEIDPARVATVAEINVNCERLIAQCTSFLHHILGSTAAAEADVRELARRLRARCEERFAGAGRTALVSLLFHRYLCPALLLPDQYRYMDSSGAGAKKSTFELRRRLTLVSKVLQNLASGALFPREDFMSVANPFLEQNFQSFRVFVDEFAVPAQGAAEFDVEARPLGDAELAAADKDISLVASLLDEHVKKAAAATAAAAAAAGSSSQPPSSSSSAAASFASKGAGKRSSLASLVPLNVLANAELHQRRVQSDILSFCSTEYRAIVKVLLADDHKRAVEIAKELSASREAKDIEKVATSLLNVMEIANCTISFLAAVMELEIEGTQSAGTLLRSTSIASRMIAHFMKMNGTRWLRAAVRESMTEIASSDAPFEIDPSKLDNADEATLKTNQANLVGFCSKILDQICASASAAPPVVREVARCLILLVARKFPDAGHFSVGGLLFLRYLCPALLAPDNFGMYEAGYPNIVRKSSSITRRFVLIAKVIQNLANGIDFGGKEDYMGALAAPLAHYGNAMKTFIDTFVVRSMPVSFPSPLSLSPMHRSLSSGSSF